MVPTPAIVTSPLAGIGTVAPLGSLIESPEIVDWALHIGLAISQQLHCAELLTLLAVIWYPPAFRKKPDTLDEAWLVIPLPDVDETIVPLPKTPGINGPPVAVTVALPPRGGSGQVSPETVVVDVWPLLITDNMPVPCPLNF